MRTFFSAKVERQYKAGRRNPFERLPEAIIRDHEKFKARKFALSQRLTRRDPTTPNTRKELDHE